MAGRFAALLAALWWGSLTTVGFLVVPLLFANLPTLAMAGGMAAKLFAAQTWVSVVCGLLLLLSSRSKRSQAIAEWAPVAIIFISLGLLMALLGQFAVAPRIVARENLRLWHSVGSVMYLVQWLCAGAVLWKLVSGPPRPG